MRLHKTGRSGLPTAAWPVSLPPLTVPVSGERHWWDAHLLSLPAPLLSESFDRCGQVTEMQVQVQMGCVGFYRYLDLESMSLERNGLDL